MKYITHQQNKNQVVFKYHTTWNLSWDELMDIMQVFLDDIKDEVYLMQYFYIAGSPGVTINGIPEGYLYKVDILQEEHGGICLAGMSRAMKMPIKLALYNQLKEVDVTVQLIDEGAVKKFEQDFRFLETYLDSLEINGYSKHSKKIGIQLVQDFVKAIENRGAGNPGKIAYKYMSSCDQLGIDPNFYKEKPMK